jgi:nicotinamide riboside transporter PnuC
LKRNYDFLLFPGYFCILFIIFRLFGIYVAPVVFCASLFSIFAALFSKRQKWWAELLYIAGNILFVIYFVRIGLFGHIWMFLFYTVLCICTIIAWKEAGRAANKSLKPSRISNRLKVSLFAGIFLSMVVMYTNGVISALDHGILFCGIAGKLLLVKKKTDGWVMWLLSNFMEFALFALTANWFLFGRSCMNLYINTSAVYKWSSKVREDIIN